MMPDKNEKTEQGREAELDRFWDIPSLIPQRRSSPPRDPKTVEAVEITVGTACDDKTEKPDAGRLTISKKPDEDKVLVKRFIPPHTAEEFNNKPVPDDEYTPEHPLIHSVRLYGRTTKYRYYEQFLNHAGRVKALHGSECGYVQYFSYVPQYSQLTKPQLSWYLWWRECFWNGDAKPTDYSYILLYLYELINTGGHGNPRWGQLQLCDIWLAYRDTYPRLDSLLGEWICDFSLIYHLAPPVGRLSKILGSVLSSCTLREFYMVPDSNGQNDAMHRMMLTYCSNYDFHNSKFAIGDVLPLYEKHIPEALHIVTERFSSSDGRILSGTGLEDSHMSRDAYAGALCSFEIKRRIELDYSSFSRSYELRYMITDIVKYSENKLRAYLGIKSRLSIYALPVSVRECIDAYFEQALPKKKKVPEPETQKYDILYDAPSIPVSPENAARIEQTSWETTEKLIEAFEEEQNAVADAITNNKKCHDNHNNIHASDVNNDMISFAEGNEKTPQTPKTYTPECNNTRESNADINGEMPSAKPLSVSLGNYIEFIVLADKRDFGGQRRYAADRKEMLELIADRINEAAVEALGDVILEEADGGYTLIDEYRKEFFDD